jgi:hypothetical protein
MSADEVQAYIKAACSAYFVSMPVIQAVQAKEERDQVLEWIEDVRELLTRTENYILDQQAAQPSGTGRWLLAEIRRLMG